MVQLDKVDALSLVSSFFPEEWAKTDINTIELKRITGGLINRLHLLARSNVATNEPYKILIRHFGTNDDVEEPTGDSISLSSAQQAIVYWEMSRRGWGPQVYGIFPGGRLEEWIESHTLTATGAQDPEVIQDVATSYARLHSLDLPLRRDGYELVVKQFEQSVQKKHEHALATLQAIDDPRAVEYASVFAATDWTHELQWVSNLFQKHHCQKTATHGDANYLNILVPDHPKDRCRTMLIDYETVSYSYRGFDIGGHFNERMYCYNQPNTQLTGLQAHSDDEQRMFCQAYFREMLLLGVPFTEYDTVEHLILEARIGRLYQILFTNLMCTVHDQVEEDPLFLSGLTHMMQTYGELKAEFLDADEAS
jgi:thiamine kinase-like enzyme